MSPERQSGRLAPVIPAYDEAATIRDVAGRTLAQLAKVIVVDDGSSDGTARELAGLPVTLIRNPRNLGKSASLWRGIALALAEGAEAVLTLDADGQHRPEDIPRLLEAHRRDPAALVVGARLHQSAAIPSERYYANRFANFWIAWAAGQPVGLPRVPGAAAPRAAAARRPGGKLRIRKRGADRGGTPRHPARVGGDAGDLNAARTAQPFPSDRGRRPYYAHGGLEAGLARPLPGRLVP